MNFTRVFTTAFSAAALVGAAFATAHADVRTEPGLPVGANITAEFDSFDATAFGRDVPADYAVTNEAGQAQAFADIVNGQNGAVIMFVRSVDWCPFCQRQVLDANTRLAELRDRNFNLVAVTTDTAEKNARFSDQRDINFTLIADPARALIANLEVADPTYFGSRRAEGLPYPVAFVVDAEGRVISKVYEEALYGEEGAYRERSDFDAVLAAIDAVNTGS